MKAFEFEDNSSETSEKVAEKSSTRVSQPISKVATDRNNAWVDSVGSQAPTDSASALGLLAFSPKPVLSEPTTFASLVPTINTSNGHNHGHTAWTSGYASVWQCKHLAIAIFCSTCFILS